MSSAFAKDVVDLYQLFNSGHRPTQEATVRPPTAIVKTDDSILVHMEIPGVAKDDISIRFLERHLVVSGTREPLEAQSRVNEIWSGTFTRRISINYDIDVDNILADAENGVLTVILPLRVSSKGVTIPVR